MTDIIGLTVLVCIIPAAVAFGVWFLLNDRAIERWWAGPTPKRKPGKAPSTNDPF